MERRRATRTCFKTDKGGITMLYLARDKNGMLGCYSVKPTKGETKWRAGLIKNFVSFVYSEEYDD